MGLEKHWTNEIWVTHSLPLKRLTVPNCNIFRLWIYDDCVFAAQQPPHQACPWSPTKFVLFSPLSFTPNKLALVSPNGEQYDSLLRQLRDRMEEGCGETIYVVGMGSGENKTVIYMRFRKGASP